MVLFKIVCNQELRIVCKQNFRKKRGLSDGSRSKRSKFCSLTAYQRPLVGRSLLLTCSLFVGGRPVQDLIRWMIWAAGRCERVRHGGGCETEVETARGQAAYRVLEREVGNRPPAAAMAGHRGRAHSSSTSPLPEQEVEGRGLGLNCKS